MTEALHTIITQSLERQVSDALSLRTIKAEVAKQYGVSMPTNASILAAYHKLLTEQRQLADQKFLRLLQVRSVRTLSGIAPITVLTKPYQCPGRCIYCPTEANMPKSYIDTEPGAMRALALRFDPYQQVTKRLQALEQNGHIPEKCELIVLGGTWTAYPNDYQEWFMKRCYDGFNEDHRVDGAAGLAEAKALNETARYRVIGCTLETRPDHIDETEVKRLRWFGATRIQIGVQSLNKHVLALNLRDQTNEGVQHATKLLKEAGLKITYHMMQNLPGSVPASDLQDIKTIFSDPGYQPDHIKIYPCVVVKSAPLYRHWKAGRYTTYPPAVLTNLLADIKANVPPYVRIERLVRDIPANSIIDGNTITNLRQIMQQKGVQCVCIRCREPRADTTGIEQADLVVREYDSADGREYFMSFEDPDHKKLFAFVRLRLQHRLKHWYEELQDAAIIRELHVYGQLVPVMESFDQLEASPGVQHKGFGRKLMEQAEQIARGQGFKKIAVIAGVGVRQYYEKLGYHLDQEYMIKII
ncbi:MAG: tRNA uridine(34) 5-carboxymethylaminomethyl modification radical SAM/GNAT enzyme Elp3 [Candidatus Kerfeldbacteria bacterium]|nr:tRNA uridine(34) 5-carboxymethylaminomethyl modification radical SAM/GNAT enzyme Elp3 [Candidatus Kerfeldbacteria bacterium]